MGEARRKELSVLVGCINAFGDWLINYWELRNMQPIKIILDLEECFVSMSFVLYFVFSFMILVIVLVSFTLAGYTKYVNISERERG